MGSSQHTQWFLSTPPCGDMHNALQEVTGLEYCTSKQHAEPDQNRMVGDEKNMQILFNFLIDHYPLEGDDSQRNISTGVTSDASVNVDKAEIVSKAIPASVKACK